MEQNILKNCNALRLYYFLLKHCNATFPLGILKTKFYLDPGCDAIVDRSQVSTSRRAVISGY